MDEWMDAGDGSEAEKGTMTLGQRTQTQKATSAPHRTCSACWRLVLLFLAAVGKPVRWALGLWDRLHHLMPTRHLTMQQPPRKHLRSAPSTARPRVAAGTGCGHPATDDEMDGWWGDRRGRLVCRGLQRLETVHSSVIGSEPEAERSAVQRGPQRR